MNNGGGGRLEVNKSKVGGLQEIGEAPRQSVGIGQCLSLPLAGEQSGGPDESSHCQLKSKG